MSIAALMSAAALAGCTRRDLGISAAVPADPLDWLLAATVVAAIVGVGVCVALMVWTPAKRTGIAGVAGFGSMIGVALGVVAVRPYVVWLVLAGFAALVVGLIYLLCKTDLAKRLAVQFGLEVSQAEDDVQVEAIKKKHAVKQRLAGVSQQITRALDQAKDMTNG